MAFLEVNYISEALMRTVTVNVILPSDRLTFPGMPKPKTENFKTLYLLHGILGNYTDWVNGTLLQRWAEEKGLAVVMPSGENMFYVDQPKTHALYGEFVGKELPDMMERMFKLSGKREDTYIAGLSMGGYGALRNGMKYADRFSYIGAFSPAVNVLDHPEKRSNDAPIFMETRDYLEALFGDLEHINASDYDPVWTAQKLAGAGKPLPKVYMACGTKDSLYRIDTVYRGRLKEAGCDVTWDEEPYAHEWAFWNDEIRKFMDFLPLDEATAGRNSGNVGI